mmetsp:Transcript_23285/g.24228  ORF Transcript_23285/g.24228 Transcript_23285/m.24228 type:complete len:681 (-) Transcript_23285:87-2129(-)|eukprot:CAMPEP_0170517550 /NCGR_PEP_ID=MMETSP0209-20121228/3497_1 /TAXON_ID=665100 ORGANISM="Litonotus pictus, Strain P1" /NCGR_SAMPLE_ID=MMETSP0209 /ASSEMBLY_ACC=CAM_ASM_000301 /LENGTH=680 /DNA_ID=CAMNT_0010802829 /DNA_START=1 /DNA_END=2043 /DNA_ORIENTATION=+
MNQTSSKEKDSSKKKDNKKDKKQKPKKQQDSDDKANYNEIYSDIKNNKWNYSIVLALVFFVFLSLYMQYQFEMQQRSFKGEGSEEIDYYDVLGLTEGASSSEIKKAYKELAKLWHPDKNPGCSSCAEKFKLIAKAEEVLRAGLEGGSGASLFKSPSTYLTAHNYHKLVEESYDFWLIVIYEGQHGNNFNQYIADAWNEVSDRFKGIIKFGVIDVLKHPNLLHYIPYKFQYFPNIFTMQHGESELMENLDLFSVTTLVEFIEESFINKVNLTDDYGIKSIVDGYRIWDATKDKESKTEGELVHVTGDVNPNTFFSAKVVVLSPKNYIEIVVKDQAKFYDNELVVYQNDLGYFDKSLSLFKSNRDIRVFVLVNNLVKKDDKYYTEKLAMPIPIKFSAQSHNSNKLQRAFIFMKPLLAPYITKNNYSRHCVNKLAFDSSDSLELAEKTRVNLCVLLIEHSNDKTSNEYSKEFTRTLIEKYRERVDEVANNKESKNSSEEMIIRTNYGIVNIERNSKVQDLYDNFKSSTNASSESESEHGSTEEPLPKKTFPFTPQEKHLFIINDTNEKFLFKSFSSPEAMAEYLADLDDVDYFQDISLGFQYFNDYHINHVSDTLNEEKFFNLTKIIQNSIYSQMKGSYVLTYILLIIANIYYLQYENLPFILCTFGISFLSGLLINIIGFFS